eukprot:UN33389
MEAAYLITMARDSEELHPSDMQLVHQLCSRFQFPNYLGSMGSRTQWDGYKTFGWKKEYYLNKDNNPNLDKKLTQEKQYNIALWFFIYHRGCTGIGILGFMMRFKS